MSHPGRFITLEGGEAAGKSTQIARLAERLRRQGRSVLELREPGGTPLGEKIRHLLKHDPDGRGMSAETELLLMNASRAELVRQRILPALQSGQIVLCDRFYDSAGAYHRFGRGLDRPLYVPTGGVGRFGAAEAVVMAALLRELGVAAADIRPEATAHDTVSSVRAVRRMLVGHAGPVFAASSAYHLARCVILLRLAGLPARPCPPPPGLAAGRVGKRRWGRLAVGPARRLLHTWRRRVREWC